MPWSLPLSGGRLAVANSVLLPFLYYAKVQMREERPIRQCLINTILLGDEVELSVSCDGMI